MMIESVDIFITAKY